MAISRIDVWRPTPKTVEGTILDVIFKEAELGGISEVEAGSVARFLLKYVDAVSSPSALATFMDRLAVQFPVFQPLWAEIILRLYPGEDLVQRHRRNLVNWLTE